MNETEGGNLLKKIRKGTRKAVKSVKKNTGRIAFNLADEVEDVAKKEYKKVEKVTNKAVNLADKVIFGTDELPPYVQKFIKKNSNMKITKMTLARSPVPKAIYKFLDTVSNIKQKTLYHLFLILYLDNGKKCLIEKNERINIATKIPKASETLDITESYDVTVGDLINNTKKLMGKKFAPYNASSNNCQVFINSILKANNIWNKTYDAFVKQDTTDIFNGKPLLRKTANTVVNEIASRGNILMNGGDIEKNNNINTKKLLSDTNNMSTVKNRVKKKVEEQIDGEGFNFKKGLKKTFSKKNMNNVGKKLKKEGKKVGKDLLKETSRAGIGAVLSAVTGSPVIGSVAADQIMSRSGADKKIDGLGLVQRNYEKVIIKGGNVIASHKTDIDQKQRGKGNALIYVNRKHKTDKMKKLAIENNMSMSGSGIKPFGGNGMKNFGGGFMPN